MIEGLWSWEDYGLPNRIYQVTHLECTAPYTYPAHRHCNQWELVYVSRGRLRHRIGSRVVDQGEGTFFLIREDDIHALSGQGFSFYNLAFPVTFWNTMEALIQPAGPWVERTQADTPPSATLAPEDRPEFEAEMDRLLHLYDPLAFVAFWARLLGRWLSVGAEGRVGEGEPGGRLGRWSPGGSPMTEVPTWLSEAVARARAAGRPPDLATFVSWCEFRPEHVARMVRRHWGLTPTELLNGLRLDRAAGLLVQTNRGVQEIGAWVGFPSTNYFHRCFRLRFGLTPGQYRSREPRPHISPPTPLSRG